MDDTHTTVATEIRRAQAALGAGEAGPSLDDLAAAPLLNDWQTILMRSSCSLAGDVSGHRQLHGAITTSALIVLDPDFTWARTMSHLHRLSSPKGTSAAVKLLAS